MLMTWYTTRSPLIPILLSASSSLFCLLQYYSFVSTVIKAICNQVLTKETEGIVLSSQKNDHKLTSVYTPKEAHSIRWVCRTAPMWPASSCYNSPSPPPPLLYVCMYVFSYSRYSDHRSMRVQRLEVPFLFAGVDTAEKVCVCLHHLRCLLAHWALLTGLCGRIGGARATAAGAR